MKIDPDGPNVDSQLVTLFGIIRTSSYRMTITLHFDNGRANG